MWVWSWGTVSTRQILLANDLKSQPSATCFEKWTLWQFCHLFDFFLKRRILFWRWVEDHCNPTTKNRNCISNKFAVNVGMKFEHTGHKSFDTTRGKHFDNLESFFKVLDTFETLHDLVKRNLKKTMIFEKNENIKNRRILKCPPPQGSLMPKTSWPCN